MKQLRSKGAILLLLLLAMGFAGLVAMRSRESRRDALVGLGEISEFGKQDAPSYECWWAWNTNRDVRVCLLTCTFSPGASPLNQVHLRTEYPPDSVRSGLYVDEKKQTLPNGLSLYVVSDKTPLRSIELDSEARDWWLERLKPHATHEWRELIHSVLLPRLQPGE